MILTYKFELRATKAQVSAFKRQLVAHSELYNTALEQKQEQYRQTKKSDSCFTQIKALIPEFRKTEAGKACNYSSLQQTVRRLHKNFAKVYARQGGKPRKKDLRSITYSRHGDGWRLKTGLYLQGIGEIPIHAHRKVDGKLTSLTVKLCQDRLYACFVTEQAETIIPVEAKAIGIDYGVKQFLTFSNGEKHENPQFLKQSLKRLRKISRQINSSHRGNVKKKRARQKIYAKIYNQRRDFQHKLSRKIVNEHSYIAIEDLDVKGMDTGVSNINRKTKDLAIAQFYNFLSYKAANAGRQLVKVNPAFTSQMCCECGKRQKLSLTQRVFSCECGNKQNRDVNAAKNILATALTQVPAIEFSRGITRHSVAQA